MEPMIQSTQHLQFNPDKHPHSTLKSFNEFVDQYEFRYNAQFTEPPKAALDAAGVKWKSEHENADPNDAQKDTTRNTWISINRVRKLLGFFATLRLQQDWKAAEADTAVRNNCTWDMFLQKMRAYYKPTENRIIRNFEFRQITQNRRETFNAFCNRVEETGRTCYFTNCTANDCNAADVAIRYQIVIGTSNEAIREKAMLKDWKFGDLRMKGMKLESAVTGEQQITHQVNKIGSYSYRSIDRKHQKNTGRESSNKCYRCGDAFVKGHMMNCKATNATCGTKGHYGAVCKRKDVKSAEPSHEEEHEEYKVLKLNIWRIKTSQHMLKFSQNVCDFKVFQVNNRLIKLLIDTGAKVSVCGTKQAKTLGLLDKIRPSSARIHPYNSEPIKVRGIAICAVTYKDRTVPVEFYILPGSCEAILAGDKGIQLKIIDKDVGKTDNVCNPVLMMGCSTEVPEEYNTCTE